MGVVPMPWDENGEWYDDERLPWEPPVWNDVGEEMGAGGSAARAQLGALAAPRAQPSRGQRLRQDADGKLLLYMQRQTEYESALDQAASEKGFDGDLDAVKRRMDLARANWEKSDKEADAAEKEERTAQSTAGKAKATGTADRFGGRVIGSATRGYWVVKVDPETGEEYTEPLEGYGGSGGAGAAASQRPTGLSNSRYLVMPDGSIVPNQYYQEDEKAPRLPSALPNSRYLVMGDGSIVPNKYYTEDTYERQRQQEQDRRKRQQERWENAQKLLANQMGLTRDMQQSQIQALPYLAAPGQTHITGGEPGGFFQRMAQAAGRSYNPDDYRAAMTTYDPAKMWDAAQRALWDWWQQQQAETEQGGAA